MEFIKSIFSFNNKDTNDTNDTNDYKHEREDSQIKQDIEANKLFTYQITSDCKNSTYKTEYWVNTLSTGQNVSLLITTIFRWGTFEIELTDSEKEIILCQETIVLNEYNCSCQELWDVWQQCHTIKNKDKYTVEELKEINKLFLCKYTIYNEAENNYIYESDTEYNFEMDILEENGWILHDTIYGFDSRCELDHSSNLL